MNTQNPPAASEIRQAFSAFMTEAQPPAKPLRIGEADAGRGVFLAPMAGYTDRSFRLLGRLAGADVTVTEMVSAKAITYGNERTFLYLQADEAERPLFVQLFGSEPEVLAEAASIVEERCPGRFAGFDVNMGCPVPKVYNNGEGSALLEKPELIRDIVRSMKKAVSKPVTVKIRKGTGGRELAVEAALAAQEGGAAAVAIHGRTRAQMYSGEADWDVIRRVKEVLSIPLIGNGDIRCGADAVRMKQETGCDGVMIARAARGNPWIFADVQRALQAFEQGLPIPESRKPSPREIGGMILLHARLMNADKGEYIAMQEMRAHLAFYARGFRGSSRFRVQMQSVRTMEELDKLVKAILMADDEQNASCGL